MKGSFAAAAAVKISMDRQVDTTITERGDSERGGTAEIPQKAANERTNGSGGSAAAVVGIVRPSMAGLVRESGMLMSG